MKYDNGKSEIKLNTNGIIKEIADHENVDNVAAIQKTLDMQPEKINERKLIDIKDKSDYDQKDEDVPQEEKLTKNFTLKEHSEILHDNKQAKDKMLETDPNLGQSMTIHQVIKKMFVLGRNVAE